jgi:hypothetical protein
MALAALDPLWRATNPNDRDLIREYAGITVSHTAMAMVTDLMNSVATVSPSTVPRVQAWIDEIIILETDQADLIADRTAHLGEVKVYEGLRPGVTPSRDDMRSEAGPVKWDTQSLYKVRIETGTGAGSTAAGQTNLRIADLKARILTAIGLQSGAPHPGAFMLERS